MWKGAMSTQSHSVLRRGLLLRAWDLGLVLVSIYVIRDWHYFGMSSDLMAWFVWGLIPTQLILFEAFGVYHVFRVRSLWEWCRRVLLGWGAVLAVVFGGLYAAKVSEQAPRLIIGSWALTGAALLVFSRVGLYCWMQYWHRRGRGGAKVLLAGEHAHCRRMARHLAGYSGFGLRVIGIVTDEPLGNGRGDRFPILGRVSDLPDLVESLRVERVLIAGSVRDPNLPGRIWAVLERHPVMIQYAPDLSQQQLIGFQAVDLGGIPVFSLSVPPLDTGQVVLKWFEDKVVAIIALILASPVMIATAILVKLTSPGPILFVQRRHGQYGRTIRVYKFRSMAVPRDASDAAAAQSGMERTPSGRFKQASGGDLRVTWIGSIIRKTSIDELPQLFNVLKGDMSIVGPRPHPIGLNSQYTEHIQGLMRRHLMKPGITGLAQVSGSRGETRSMEDMRRRIAFDLHYIRNWSIWLDLKILLLTPIRGIMNRQP